MLKFITDENIKPMPGWGLVHCWRDKEYMGFIQVIPKGAVYHKSPRVKLTHKECVEIDNKCVELSRG